ncbi:hypothetical protein ACIBQ6_12315 [Nonomuraea sp. NPDC049655]
MTPLDRTLARALTEVVIRLDLSARQLTAWEKPATLGLPPE